MNFNQLYNELLIKNIVGWSVATDPTEDSYKAEEITSLNFDKSLKKFIEHNPSSNVSIFNNSKVLSNDLEEKRFVANQKLWKKYLSLKKDKLPVDQEYFDLFNSVITAHQNALISKGLDTTNSIYFIDSPLASHQQVFSLVKKLSAISQKFIQSNTQNIIKPLKNVDMTDITYFLNAFPDVGYKISDKNGSFMTPYDKNNSRIHIAKNADMMDMFTSATHEVGHALYQNRILNKNTEIGQLGQFLSISLHESASIVTELALSGIDFQITKNRNNIRRLTSDKIHYIIHIYMRMEIEDLLFSNQIKAEDIPHVWNSLSQEYLGMEPLNDWEGFLQDVHWNSGAFGYFHSYAIGFFNAITMLISIQDKITDNLVESTEQVILPHIETWFGKFNESSSSILEQMHPNLELSLKNYEDFIFTNFSM